MEFRILGPLEALADGEPVALGPAKQRALLGALLLRANEVVSTQSLVDEVWGERPPATAAKLVQVYVSQLRRVLAALGAAAVLQTRAPGYLAVVDAEQLDAERFRRLVQVARSSAQAGAHDDAVDAYDEALALWRGPVLADVEREPHVLVEAERLHELRLAALGERIDCELARGRHARVIGELEALTAQHPLHERFWAQLMRALYGAGRQSEALGAYHQARRTLLDQVGVEPGPELRGVEKAILAHDPSLALHAPAAAGAAAAPARIAPARRRRRRTVIALGLVVAAAGAAAIALVLTGRDGSRPAPRVVPDSAVMIDPRTNALVRTIRLHTRPAAIAAGGGSVWVGSRDDETLLQLDPRTGTVRKTIGLGAEPTGITVGDGYVWVVSPRSRSVFELDAATGSLVRRRVLGGKIRVGPFRGDPLPAPFYVAAGGGAAWVAHGGGVVTRIDERTGATQQISAGSDGGVAYGDGAVWALAGPEVDALRNRLPARDYEVSRIDPRRRAVTAVVPPPRVGVPESIHPFGLVAGAGALWVVDSLAQTLWKVDPALERVTAVLPVRHEAVDLTATATAAWTANNDGTVTRVGVDGTVGTIPLGRYPRVAFPVSIAAGEGGVWIAMH